MRRVERGLPPQWISQKPFKEACDSFASFHAVGGSRKEQTRMPLTMALGSYAQLAANYAHETFLGKCAYSEVPVERQLYLHRPEGDAYDDRGVSAEHYWWTATWYRNWYVASEEVASRKRTSFPVIGPRAKVPRVGQVSATEVDQKYLDHGVLLDPCDSHPELHLHFDREGYVRGWGEEGATWLGRDVERGTRTIEILGLNSDSLLKSRREAIRPALAWAGDGEPPLHLLLESLPHVGAVRQVLAGWLLSPNDRNLTKTHQALLPEMVPLIALDPSRYRPELVRAVRESLEPGSPHAKALGGARRPTPAPGRKPPTIARPPRQAKSAKDTLRIPRTSALEHVRIVNFQAIERAEINISASQSLDQEAELPTASTASSPDISRPWRVLLGENGSGKSSTLRAIAMALSTTDRARLMRQTHLRWEDLLRRDTDEGHVELVFTQGERILLRFNRRRGWFEGGAPEMLSFVRGFGATRLLSETPMSLTQHIRLGNLFRPQVPVINAERWLAGLGTRDLNVVAVAIAQLLDRDEEVSASSRGRDPFIVKRGDTMLIGGEPLKTMSDGYRAVIAMACDLMAGAGIGLSDMANATGIVLIDELGAHLHPRWKMQITTTLRKVFPSMQFIVTTHEPLCLRGLGANEVIAVRPSDPRQRPGWKAVLEPIPESPNRYRIDGLLMSSFFGLGSTIDPDVKRDFDQYYALIRIKNPTAADRDEREKLRARVSKHGVLGYTARDQLVYDFIDEYLANKVEGEGRTPEQRAEDRQEVFKQVTDVWRNVEERHQRATGTP